MGNIPGIAGEEQPRLTHAEKLISEIQASLKTAAVLERLEVLLHLGLWQLSLAGPGNSKRHLLGASSTCLIALVPSVSPWHGTCHL